jgi:hypothetical protein
MISHLTFLALFTFLKLTVASSCGVVAVIDPLVCMFLYSPSITIQYSTAQTVQYYQNAAKYQYATVKSDYQTK